MWKHDTIIISIVKNNYVPSIVLRCHFNSTAKTNVISISKTTRSIAKVTVLIMANTIVFSIALTTVTSSAKKTNTICAIPTVTCKISEV